VRGYDYQTIGPQVDGEVVGGSGLLAASFELDWTFLERWALAAFVDSGSAYDREPSFKTGVGLGLRWFSPVGAIRVDVALPLDDPDHSVRLHVTLGPDL
jgi:translocation and assembly module TamA